jgi:uncharacterized protein (DUF2147 family)
MKRLVLLAALGLASGPVQAQKTITFEVNGQTVRVTIPKACDGGPCVSITTGKTGGDPRAQGDERDMDRPGARIGSLISKFLAGRGRRDLDDPDEAPASTARVTPPAIDETAPAPVAPPIVAPQIAAPGVPAPGVPAPPPTTTSRLEPDAPAPAPQIAPIPAPNPAVAPSTIMAPAAPVSATLSPAGVWTTQNKEGKVHISACGVNYCGYVVDPKTGKDGVQVLIDMKPDVSGAWSGRVHDPKGGGTYDATIALKGKDGLAIKGCGLGGLICRGQTWSRG